MTKIAHAALAFFVAACMAAAPVATAPVIAATVVTVNDIAITDAQISARARLLGLEGRGSAQSAARQELIDEALMMSEARRVGITVSDAEVGNAMLTVARNLKMGMDNLLKVLADNGVNPDTLRDRLRAAIAWQRVVGQVVMGRVQISDLELDQAAAGKVTAANSFDYILKEIIFVGGSRTSAANQYRGAFKGCDTAVDLSLRYTDAAVVDVGRRHATQLPAALATELAGLNVGGITKPRATDAGVSMYAVCEKAVATDTTFIKDSLMQEAGNEALQAEAKKYLEELRAKARIY